MNADVEKAVELLTQFAKHEQNCIGDYWGKDCALLSIAVMTKALRDQEAEIARLQDALAKHVDRVCGADALLRECLTFMELHPATHARITAHLGAEQ